MINQPGAIRRRPMLIPMLLTILATACGDPEPPDAAGDDQGGMAGMSMAADPSAGTPEAGVRLTADQIRTFGVRFDTAAMTALVDTVRAVGIIAWDETRISQVSSRVSGYIEDIRVDFTGRRVRAGEQLFTLYSPEITAASEELLTAAALAQDSGVNALPGFTMPRGDLVGAARRRLEQWDVPTAAIDRMLATGTVPRAVPFVAPTSGIVIEKGVQQGQAIAPGQRLYVIADPAAVWIDLAFREADAARVSLGAVVDIALTNAPGAPRRGRISFIHPALDTTARTVRARVELPNPDGRLQPGRYVSASTIVPSRMQITVPSSAVIQTGEGALVFRATGGSLHPTEIRTGESVGGRTVIHHGLAVGDSVVTSAQYLLEAETNVGALMRAMLGQVGSGGAMSEPGGMPGMEGMTMPNGAP